MLELALALQAAGIRTATLVSANFGLIRLLPGRVDLCVDSGSLGVSVPYLRPIKRSMER